MMMIVNEQQQKRRRRSQTPSALSRLATSGILTLVSFTWVAIWLTVVELAGRTLTTQVLYTLLVTAPLFVLYVVLYVQMVRIVSDGQLVNDALVSYLVLFDWLLLQVTIWPSVAFYLYWLWVPVNTGIEFWSNFASVTSSWSAWGRLLYTSFLIVGGLGFGQYVPVEISLELVVSLCILSNRVMGLIIPGVGITLAFANSLSSAKTQR